MSKELEDYNFQSIKKFVACKDCQYYLNEKCTNTTGCFWIDLEKKLVALEIIKTKMPDIKEFRVFNAEHKKATVKDWNYYHPDMPLNQDEFDLLKEQLCYVEVDKDE